MEIPVIQSKVYPGQSSAFRSLSPPSKKTSCYDLLVGLLELGKSALEPNSQPLNSNHQLSRASIVGPDIVPVMPIPIKPSVQQNTWTQSPPHFGNVSNQGLEDFKPQQFQYLQPITKIEYRSIISANLALVIIFTSMIFIFWNAGHTSGPPINPLELRKLIVQMIKSISGTEKKLILLVRAGVVL